MLKKIMILGAGPFQLPGILKAVDSGCHVITVDYLPDNIGHRYSHEYVNCSTVDKDGVLRAAQKAGIDAICTFASHVAVPTVGYVAERMGLKGCPTVVAETMASKHGFREFQLGCGLQAPRCVHGRDFPAIEPAVLDLHFPVIFKPNDTSGSRGVFRVDTRDQRECEQAFSRARSFSPSGTVCVEEFVRGVEVGGDGILQDGRFLFVAVTHKHLAGFVVTGHSLPAAIGERDQRRVVESVELCCQKLGYTDGPLNFDVMVDGDTITVLELSPRNGGNGIPAVIERATGVDLELLNVQWALGERCEVQKPGLVSRGCGSLIFGSRVGGRLGRIADEGALRRAVPGVWSLRMAVGRGERVGPFVHNGNLVGYVLFDCEDAELYHNGAERIVDALGLEVLPDCGASEPVLRCAGESPGA